MAEILRVDEHPQGCTICMAVSGPFAVFKLAGYIVQTVEGPIQVDTDFVLCARNDSREGCIGQAARHDGYVAPDEHENVVRQATELLDRYEVLERKAGELEAKTTLDRKALAAEVAEEIIARAG